MAFLDFAETQYIKSLDTGETPRLGTFQTAKSFELRHMRLGLYISGVVAGIEQLRVKIYADNQRSQVLYTSDWSNLSDISNISSRWIGVIRIDFNSGNINKNLIYYVNAETNNYTRNGEVFWLGLLHDFPFPIYDNSENFFYKHPLKTEIFGDISRADQ